MNGQLTTLRKRKGFDEPPPELDLAAGATHRFL
jgi:hypothetical protein